MTERSILTGRSTRVWLRGRDDHRGKYVLYVQYEVLVLLLGSLYISLPHVGFNDSILRLGIIGSSALVSVQELPSAPYREIEEEKRMEESDRRGTSA